MADEQRHHALERAGILHKPCDLGGKIKKAAPGRLNREARRHDRGGADGGQRGAKRWSGWGHKRSFNMVVPANAGIHTPRPQYFGQWKSIPSTVSIAGGYGSRRSPGRLMKKASCDAVPSNLARDILLHPVGHLDQPPPRLLQK